MSQHLGRLRTNYSLIVSLTVLMVWLLTLFAASALARQQAQVNYQCFPRPSNLVATALSTTQVHLTWTASPGLNQYQIERRPNINGPIFLINVTGTSFVDTSVTGGATYLYRVRATNSSNNQFSDYSNMDIATTIVFTDSTISPGVTMIRALHFTEMRQAVNSVRVAANLGAFNWPEVIQTGVTIKAVHMQELRDNLNLARGELGLLPQPFADSIGPGVAVKKAHVEEIRQGVK